MTIPPYGDEYRKYGYFFTTLKVSANPNPAMYVNVTSGIFWNGNTLVECSGGNSPVLTAPTTGSKICLVYITDRGAIRIEDGTPASNPSVPKCPKGGLPIGMVIVSSGDTKIQPDKVFDIKALTTSISSHSSLDDRIAQNSHTIESITNLRLELDDKPNYNDVINMLLDKASIDGTPSETFILNKDHTGTPLSNVMLQVNRGSENPVAIRWNETLDKWEFSNGSTFYPLDAVTFTPATNSDLGGVIVGQRLNIDGTGILNATLQTECNYTFVDKAKVDNFPSNLQGQLDLKVDKITGKQLSTEDYTTLEKNKLTNIQENANNYVHPVTHQSNIITQDETHRFVSDVQIITWDNKVDSTYVDTKITEVVGAAPDALNTLQELSASLGNDNNYAATMTTALSNKVDKIAGKQLSTEDYTTLEKNKLVGIESSANNYVHPVSHSASMILEETDKRFMLDMERIKLTNIAENANNYIHPENHLATIIVEDASHRFFTDVERTKLTGIEESANNYVHPVTHNAIEIVSDETHRFVSDVQITSWDNKVDSTYVDTKITEVVGVAPEALNTLQELSNALGDDANYAATMTTSLSNKVDKVTGKQLSTEDYTTAEKTKLAGIETSANNYIHPLTHSANEIVEVTDKRFMLEAERTKLSLIEDNANNYVHPVSHDATMIVQDTSNRMVTDSQISIWNGKQTPIFISMEQLGTGAEQTLTHTLGHTPTAVFVSVTKTNAVTDWSIVEGIHDSIGINVTVTSGVNYKVMTY